jgi:hypothetical protein
MIQRCFLSMIASCAVTFCSWAADADEAGRIIREQVSRINEAWRSDTGVDIMRDVLSEAFTISLPAPDKPGAWSTMNREQFCTAFGRMLKENPPKEHVRQTTAITVQGGIAYESGVSIHVAKSGARTSDEILNVWRQEGKTWRLFFSAGAQDLRDALQKK